MNVAVGESNADSEFILEENSLFSRLVSQDSNNGLDGTLTKMMTLDSICDSLRIQKVDWVKIDVEEGASSAIKGGSRVLSNEVKLFLEVPRSGNH